MDHVTPDVLARFWSKVDKGGHGGCWLWTASRNTGGYARFALNHRKGVLAHRFAYELLVGPIPEGMELDHVRARGCRHRHCVNPEHLEPVTSRTNLRRSAATQATINGTKTRCIHGHPFDEVNTYVKPDGRRVCRTCRTLEKRRRRERNRRG